MVEPDGVADDFRRETMALVAELYGIHGTQCAKHELT